MARVAEGRKAGRATGLAARSAPSPEVAAGVQPQAARRSRVESRVYYCCRVRVNTGQVFVAWSAGEPDGFLRDAAGRLLVARSAEELAALTRAREVIPARGEPADYDFDGIRQWCAAPEEAGVDCPT